MNCGRFSMLARTCVVCFVCTILILLPGNSFFLRKRFLYFQGGFPNCLKNTALSFLSRLWGREVLSLAVVC